MKIPEPICQSQKFHSQKMGFLFGIGFFVVPPNKNPWLTFHGNTDVFYSHYVTNHQSELIAAQLLGG